MAILPGELRDSSVRHRHGGFSVFVLKKLEDTKAFSTQTPVCPKLRWLLGPWAVGGEERVATAWSSAKITKTEF